MISAQAESVKDSPGTKKHKLAGRCCKKGAVHSFLENTRRRAKPKKPQSSLFDLPGVSYFNCRGDLYPDGCSLAWLNSHGLRGKKRADFADACGRHTCPACVRYGLAPRIKSIQLTNKQWKLPKYTIRVRLKSVPESKLTVTAIGNVVAVAEGAAEIIGIFPEALAHFVKVEVAQGKRDINGEDTALFHLHVCLMTEPDWPLDKLSKALRRLPLVTDVWIAPLIAEKQISYLGKAYIKNTDWKPVLRAQLIRVMNQWQKKTGRKRLFWFGGWFDRRKQRQPLRAARALAQLESESSKRGGTGWREYFRRRRQLLELPFVAKWEHLSTLYIHIPLPHKHPAKIKLSGKPVKKLSDVKPKGSKKGTLYALALAQMKKRQLKAAGS